MSAAATVEVMAVSSTEPGHEGADCLTLPDTSDPRVGKLLQYLLAGRDYGDCARLLKVSVRTVWTLREKHQLDEYIARLNTDALSAAATGYVMATKLVFQEIVRAGKSRKQEDRRWAVEQYSRIAKTGGDRSQQSIHGHGQPQPAAPPHQPARRLSNADLIERARIVTAERQRR